MELNAMQRLHELKAWKDRQPASANAAPVAVRPVAPATPARKTNRELLAVVRSEASNVERNRAAETLRRQLKTLCAATLSRRGDGFTSGELEDLTQDVFLRLLQSSTEADPTAAYIARIAANLLIDKRRHAVRRGQNQARLSLDETIAEGGPARDVVDPSEGVEESVLTRLNNRALRDAIERLLKPAEATVVLRRAEGLAHDEIALETGQSCASVRKQYERGIKRLQTYAENGLLVAV